MSSQTKAWILDVGSGQQVAVSPQQLREFVHAAEILRVPLARDYCAGVIVWRGQLVPVVELPVLLGAEASVAGSVPVGVLAYRDAPGEPLRHGAVPLASEPRESWVNDEMACALPRELASWRAIALSCFRYAGSPVPILHLRRLFNEPLERAAVGTAAPSKAIRTESAARRGAPAPESHAWQRQGTPPWA